MRLNILTPARKSIACLDRLVNGNDSFPCHTFLDSFNAGRDRLQTLENVRSSLDTMLRSVQSQLFESVGDRMNERFIVMPKRGEHRQLKGREEER